MLLKLLDMDAFRALSPLPSANKYPLGSSVVSVGEWIPSLGSGIGWGSRLYQYRSPMWEGSQAEKWSLGHLHVKPLGQILVCRNIWSPRGRDRQREKKTFPSCAAPWLSWPLTKYNNVKCLVVLEMVQTASAVSNISLSEVVSSRNQINTLK